MVRSSGAVITVGVRACTDARHVLQRDRIDQSMSPESRAATRVESIADGVEHRLVEIVLGLAPPVRILPEHGLHAGLMLDDHERAGAVGLEREGAQGIGGSGLCLGGLT